MPEIENDHDLLVEIKTKLERVIYDVQDLKHDLVTDVANLKSEKFDKDEAARELKTAAGVHTDHEKRLRRIEQWAFIVIGGLSIAQIALQVFLNLRK